MRHSIETLKTEARRLRQGLADAGQPVSHSRSLELVAKQKGFRDWNTAHAACGNAIGGPPVQVGQTVTGTYLGQRFTADVIGVSGHASHGRYRVDLDLAEPVDVVTFESFSNYRRRVQATIGASGATAEKTSDGRPHLVLDIG